MDQIYFSLGLHLNIGVTDRQNKSESHISIDIAKLATSQSKIGQDATFAPPLNGHNSAIFHLILTSDHIKMISLRDKSNGVNNLVLSDSFEFSVFDTFFSLRPHMGSIARMDPKPPSSCWYMSRPLPPPHRSKSCFQTYEEWNFQFPTYLDCIICYGFLIRHISRKFCKPFTSNNLPAISLVL